jgi:hypothetical protein
MVHVVARASRSAINSGGNNHIANIEPRRQLLWLQTLGTGPVIPYRKVVAQPAALSWVTWLLRFCASVETRA